MNILYDGDYAWLGKIGHFSILVSFIGAIVACISYYFFSVKDLNSSIYWKKNARIWLIIHVFATILAISLLLMGIHLHAYPYKYIWQHSSNDLPFKYLFSALWEGQEGSTLLWMFWHSILGCVLLLTAKDYESKTLFIVTLAQVMLGSMILGLHITIPDIHLQPFSIHLIDYKVGSNPFSLMKDVMDIPVFNMNPNYVFEDGNGLNPLLQNYWMVIHPPTLFLGFAATTIPFAFVFGGLWAKDFKSWIKPCLNWSLFALMVLGAGILMGGAWAYEALSFGGFWAWDPVENASLVPWLLLAAATHSLLIYKKTSYSLHSTIVLYLLSFLLIMYSSFLTKSGILGDSSVHSFADLGMSSQLVLCIAVFLIPSIALFLRRYELLKTPKIEEATSSREFWMFVGALLFFIAALHIIIFTSFPVINKIIGTKYAPPKAQHYNSVDIWLAIMAAFISAGAQFLSYKSTPISKIKSKLSTTFLISLLISIPIIIIYKFYTIDYLLLCVSSIYTIVANIYFLYSLKINKNLLGSSLSHIGFGLILIGILISQGRQYVISLNKFGVDYGEGFSEKEKVENILLYENEPETMRGYKVTYQGDSIAKPNIYFKVLYEKLNKKGEVVRTFSLAPTVQMNKKMGNVVNPSTYNALDKDLYTHITSAPLKEDGSPQDSLKIDQFNMAVGDTISVGQCLVVLEDINPDATITAIEKQPEDIAVGARLRIIERDTNYIIEPVYFIRSHLASSIPSNVKSLNSKFLLTKIIPEEAKIEITVEHKIRKFIIMKALIFPFIKLLWLGCFVMIFGIGFSLYNHIQNKRSAH
jgi:cytochrome c-type biogenesis protein CcmF